ncbi:hypothetical protein GCM10010363_59110 [Streptomyces omiyaensis]|nr:hypothetical protein GCM10010363_59110 [Streptomyces omiyaensis]
MRQPAVVQLTRAEWSWWPVRRIVQVLPGTRDPSGMLNAHKSVRERRRSISVYPEVGAPTRPPSACPDGVDRNGVPPPRRPVTTGRRARRRPEPAAAAPRRPGHRRDHRDRGPGPPDRPPCVLGTPRRDFPVATP